MTSCSKELGPLPTPKRPLQITTRTLKEPDFKFELMPLHSPLLGQSLLVSFPPLIDMLKFSGYPYLIRGQTFEKGFMDANVEGRDANCAALYHQYVGRQSLSGESFAGQTPNTKQCLRVQNDARTGMPHGIPRGAMCVQRFDDSLNSAIHTTFRISLRSSSMPEPRDPLLKVVIIVYFLTLIATTKRFDNVQPAGKPAEETYGTQKTRVQQGPKSAVLIMILPQVHLRKPCYDFYFL